ncbi:MAG: DUF5906 domain-containing protein [Candidatus Marinimicrobia bacterium]|nr:DUF5906 domain-containing protein [Candidatus Neomarinimicrobiota bacterium]
MKGTFQEVQAEIFSAKGGRDDVYALQDSTGNYYPKHSPFTLDIYQDDSTTVGAYLVGSNDLVKSAVIDIDINKKDLLLYPREVFEPLLKKQTLQIKSVLDAHGFSSVIEDSGNKGYHIWIFLSQHVSAADMRHTLHILEKEFQLVDPRLHWELFPKQDRVAPDKLGNLIKLPFQFHKVTNRRCAFVDSDFEAYLPQVLPINDIELITKAPVNKGNAGHKATGIVHKDIRPHNMDLMFSKCSVLQRLAESSDPSVFEGTTGHTARLFLASQMIPFGNKGRDKVHEILSQANDYNESITDYQLDSISGSPQTCEIMCGNQKCANICKADGNSPIKFGYMDDLFVFLEKQTSSFAYLDHHDEQLYFVDSEKKLDIILADADQKRKAKTPVRKLIFDPSQDVTIDKVSKTINLFRPTDFMVGEKTSKVIDLTIDAPSINHLLSNLIPIDLERDRFVNWLAGIMQTRSKQLTAWVFMGQPGAGKNVLLDHVLKPLFGEKQAIKVEDEQLKNPFNGWLQNAILIAFNEVAHDNRTRNSINSKVKAIITDNDIMINEKNVKVFTIDNHANALFFSNESIPVLIEENDRRFNVVRTGGNMRKQSWFADPEQFLIDMKAELSVFAEYLINYNYDPTLAKTVISNGVKDALVDVGMTRYAEFSSHLKANDVDWFVENMDSLFPTSTIKAVGLNGSIEKDSALAAFREIYQDDRITKSKLTKELKLQGIRTGEINGKRVYRWD